MIARITGSGERLATYEISDNQMAAGSAWTRAMLWEYDDEENVELKK